MQAGSAMSDPVADYVAGAVAGSANIVTGYPFDTVKVRLQAQHTPYTGAWQCFKSVVHKEGVHGLFKGLSSPLVGGALETGVNYAVFSKVMDWLQDSPTVVAVPVSAATAGFFLSFIVSPVELIKCRMQLGIMDTAHSYTGPLDCMRQLVRSEGYRGLMRGLGATMAREMPGNAVYFGSYLAMRELLPGKAPDPTQPRTLLKQVANAGSAVACGAVAGMAMWAIVLPIDLGKTRIQTAWPGTPSDVGLRTQMLRLYRTGGASSLYAGLSPVMLRAAPANAAQWLAWELCIEHWRERRRKQDVDMN